MAKKAKEEQADLVEEAAEAPAEASEPSDPGREAVAVLEHRAKLAKLDEMRGK